MHEDSKQSAAELRLKQVTRYVSLAIVAILALCMLFFMYVGTIKQDKAVAQQNQQIQAQAAMNSETCKVHPDQQICTLAHQILENPAQALPDPADTSTTVTATGREVKTFTLNKEGNLVVTYADGTSGTIGRVTGSTPSTGTEALSATGTTP
jgi:type II secretory pathway pseudopilin PulG